MFTKIARAPWWAYAMYGGVHMWVTILALSRAESLTHFAVGVVLFVPGPILLMSFGWATGPIATNHKER